MTQTPTPRFVTRPTPPAINTPEYDRWTKESSLAFPGGTITSSYGNLIQTLAIDTIGFNCNPTTKNVSVPQATVERTIGGAIVSAKVDVTHPVAYGFESELPLFRRGETLLKPSVNAFATPVRYTEKPLLSGYIGPERLQEMSDNFRRPADFQG